MIKCTDCTYSIFDKLWGEYKCKVLQHRIHDPHGRASCPHYKKDAEKAKAAKKPQEEEDE